MATAFFPYKTYGDFIRRSRAATSAVIIMIIIIIKTLFKEEAQLDVHPIFPGVSSNSKSFNKKSIPYFSFFNPLYKSQ